MQLPPGSVLEKWPTPNYINPESRGSYSTITVSVLLGIVTLILVVRIYTRIYISRGFGLDDVFILLAYLPTAAFGILSIVAQVKFAWGRHVWDVPFNLFSAGLQISLASQLLFALAATLTKLSMLSLIYRVVSVDRSRYRYIVLAVSCIVALDGLIFFFVTIFQCSPVSAYWTLSVARQKCINEPAHLLAAGCINTATDFIIVLIPIPYVMRLRLPKKQQIIIGSLFAGGIFVSAAGAVRTYITFTLYMDPNKDMTWNAVPIIITSALELYIGIVCASVPPIKPFFARYLPSLVGNPKYWLSRQGESQRFMAEAPYRLKNAEGDNFWLATAFDDDDAGASSPGGRSSSPLIMQMQAGPGLPGMPTPTRPPRTQSTYRAIPSMLYRPNTGSSAQTSGGLSVTSSTIPTSSEVVALARQASLNKPLPRIPSGTRLDWPSMAAAAPAAPEAPEALEEEEKKRESTSKNVLSVYQFVPHEDGHISVVRTKGGDAIG